MAEDAVSASAKGATFLILLQIGSRAVTFVLNQYLLRFLSPELLGISVQLELFKIGTMYFSRESLRVAAERRSDGGLQASINLSYLAILAGLPIGTILAEWYLRSSFAKMALFSQALRVNQLAAFVELLMEPAFTAVQHNLLYKFRAAAEGSSVILKTLTVFSLVLWSRSRGTDLGALPFAAGELVNSITLTSVYWVLVTPIIRKQGISLFPKRMVSSSQYHYVFSFFSKPLLWLMGSLFIQTNFKWLLTHGDGLLVGTLASLDDQGMYALAANYGGLIARMLFQPIETSSRNLFASLCAAHAQQTSEASGTAEKPKDKSKATSDTEKANVQSAAQLLIMILRAYAIMSLLCVSLGPTAGPLLLRVVAGSRWTDSGAGEVLGAYCYYIPLLAINGVSEAFVAATASSKDLRIQTLWMAGFFALFAGSAWTFLVVLGMGAKGLVWANCVNMLMRVVFNFWFVRGYFAERSQDFKVTHILPNLYAIAATAVVPSVLSQSQGLALVQPYSLLGELARVGAVGLSFSAFVALLERGFLRDCYRKMRP